MLLTDLGNLYCQIYTLANLRDVLSWLFLWYLECYHFVVLICISLINNKVLYTYGLAM